MLHTYLQQYRHLVKPEEQHIEELTDTGEKFFELIHSQLHFFSLLLLGQSPALESVDRGTHDYHRQPVTVQNTQ